jgi:hypothetical protein
MMGRHYRDTEDVAAGTIRLIKRVCERIAEECDAEGLSAAVLGLRAHGTSDVQIAAALGRKRQAISKRWPGGGKFKGPKGHWVERRGAGPATRPRRHPSGRGLPGPPSPLYGRYYLLRERVEPSAITWSSEPAGRTYNSDFGNTSSYHYQHHERADRAVAPAVAQAYERLCLTQAAPQGLVDAVYRWWALQFHPDRGGDGEQMVELNQAVERIRKEAS